MAKEVQMLQPVLVVLDVPDGTDRTELGKRLENYLRGPFTVPWCVPMDYTLTVPEGMITSG